MKWRISLLVTIALMPVLLWGCSPRTVGVRHDVQQTQQVALYHYVIKENVDLEGKTIKLPKGGTLVFENGTIRNGTIVFNHTTISGENPSFRDVKVKGTLANQAIYSNWFKSSAEGNDYLTSIIKTCCNSSSDFVFNEGKYRFTEPIYLFGRCNLSGEGDVNLVVDMGKGPFFLLAGNDTIGGKNPITWHGKIDNLKFIANRGSFNYFVNLINVQDCEISNCLFDMSGKGVNCYNKVIASVNNAKYSNPSKGRNIVIKNNRIIIHHTKENRNNSEPIGVESRENVTIEDNTVLNARDDVGIHGSANVTVRNNDVTAYDGRIFVSNSTDVVIENNNIKYVFPSTTGMGVYVGVESGYDKIPERITIKNNYIDYTQAAQRACYGIRVIGANYVTIVDNVITGNNYSRIAIEYTEAKQNQNDGLLNKGMLVPHHVLVKGNTMNELWLAGYKDFIINSIRVVDNTINKVVSVTNKNIVFERNRMKKTTKIYAAPTKDKNVYK